MRSGSGLIALSLFSATIPFDQVNACLFLPLNDDPHYPLVSCLTPPSVTCFTLPFRCLFHSPFRRLPHSPFRCLAYSPFRFLPHSPIPLPVQHPIPSPALLLIPLPAPLPTPHFPFRYLLHSLLLSFPSTLPLRPKAHFFWEIHPDTLENKNIRLL